ncbi:MAG: hypothetical protein ACR2K0_09720 [Acidimicrobiales bacterium]
MTPAWRLLGASGAALLMVLVVASPAAAAEPTVTWARPTVDEPSLKAPGSITGTIATRAADRQTIEQVEFDLIAEGAADDPEDPCFVDFPEDQRIQTFSGDNASETFEVDLDFACNRAYELVATVTYGEPLVGGVSVGTKTSTAGLFFDVAIPPAPVSGLAASYDPATKQVGLSWGANTEVDLVGYLLERNPPGSEPFSFVNGGQPITQTSFTETIAVEDEHRYRVTAVRRGPDADSQIRGQPSGVVTAGPERPEPTVPDAVAPNTRRAPDGTAGAAKRPSGGNRAAAPRSRTRTTVDDGFAQRLPFDPSQTTTVPPTSTPEPSGDAAVVARVDGGTDDDDRRDTLVPIAGGLALVMGAAHLRLLSKRASEPDIPIVGR